MIAEDSPSLNMAANNENKIYLSEPVSLFQRWVMVATGVSLIIVGLMNCDEKFLLGLFDIGIGVGNILIPVFYGKQVNRDLYISWNVEEIIFRVKLFKRPLHIRWDEIENITESNCQLYFNYRDGSCVLKYSDLTYLQRKKTCPIYLKM